MSRSVPRFHAITEACLGRSHAQIAERAAEGGADLIQFRDKQIDIRRFLQEGEKARNAAKRHGALFIVNDRVDAALALHADGVHLGQTDMPASAARRLMGSEALIGVTAPTAALAKQAQQDGADYVGFGPIFGTRSKPDARAPVGVEGLRAYCATVSLPVIAIGGIGADVVPALLEAGAYGVAVLSAVSQAEDVKAAAKKFALRWRRPR